jgi:DNA-binding transcriptional regulator GbsR (MarR family)
MYTDLFRRIANCVKAHDLFFEQRRNCHEHFVHRTIQKVTVVLRRMAYGIPQDLVEDHLETGETTSIKCVKQFTKITTAETLTSDNPF